jgi:hypothetical protein
MLAELSAPVAPGTHVAAGMERVGRQFAIALPIPAQSRRLQRAVAALDAIERI